MNRLEKAKIKNLKIARTEKMQSKDKEVKNEPSEDPEIKNESISEIKNDTTSKKEMNVVYVPPVKYDLYMMPDGNKYTYDQLIVIYPTLKNEMAMKNNFK